MLEKAPGDFAVTYELNAYCLDVQAMARRRGETQLVRTRQQVVDQTRLADAGISQDQHQLWLSLRREHHRVVQLRALVVAADQAHPVE